MEKLFIYTFLFYFLCLFCRHFSPSLHHPSLGLCNIKLTLQQRVQPFLLARCPFLRALNLDILISLYPASSLFEIQHQLTYRPVKSSGLPLRSMSVSQGVLLDIMFSYYPVLVLFNLVFTHITHQ